MTQESQAAEAGDYLPQQFESLAAKIRCQDRQASNVATRPRKASDEATCHRVAHHRGDDRDNRCRLHCLNDRWCPRCDNDINFEPDELSRDFGQSLDVALRPANLERDRAALDPAEFTQSLHQYAEPLAVGPGRARDKQPDGRQFAWLLRPRRERPRCCRTADQRDELAAGTHSITSSASASNLSGTVSPSALAVLRLITKSYLIGYCTGRSAAFSPLRMRST